MSNTDKEKKDPIPEQFDSYEEAAMFWEAHDTADYAESLQPVEVDADLRQRHVEVEIDEDLAAMLRKKAKQRGLSLSRLVSDLLRKQVT